MALQKKVKTLYLEYQAALAWNATVVNFYPAVTRRVTDDIRIIGCQMTVSHGGDATAMAALGNGSMHTHGELSLVGDRGKDGSIFDLNLQSYLGIIVAGVSFLGAQLADGAMFPEGHGIDLDEGAYIYLHAGLFQGGMFTAGAAEHSIFCVVYYVER